MINFFVNYKYPTLTIYLIVPAGGDRWGNNFGVID